MKIEKNYLTQNPCYKTGRTIRPTGIMLHSVGCSQPKASVFLNTWNRSDFKNVCVHAFIDANTGVIYQTLPWTMRGWHAGGSANNTHIGVEMCESNHIKYTGGANFTIDQKNLAAAQEQAKRAYNSAVELFAYICKEKKLNPLVPGVIMSHHEGHLRGIASNHGDPEHYWKGLKLPYTMDQFRADVGKLVGIQNDTKSVPFQVKVSIDDLNIRKGPGTNYDTIGKYTGKGVFTIVEVQGNWGLLKAYEKGRNGWISLKYGERL